MKLDSNLHKNGPTQILGMRTEDVSADFEDASVGGGRHEVGVAVLVQKCPKKDLSHLFSDYEDTAGVL